MYNEQALRGLFGEAIDLSISGIMRRFVGEKPRSLARRHDPASLVLLNLLRGRRETVEKGFQ